MSDRPRVAIRLSKQATPAPGEGRYAIETSELATVADLVEVTDSPDDAPWADALIVSWGVRVNADTIARLGRCRIIAVGSIGVDMVDVDAATAAGMVVTNVPDIFIEDVADQAMLLLLATWRRLKQADALAASNRWYEGRALLGEVPRLMGRTLGLLGFGNVARCVARRAQAFGVRIIAHDPYVSELVMTTQGVEPVGLTELFSRTDLLSIHAPLNDETRHLVNRRHLALMPAGSVLVNTARGGLIDEDALIDALDRGHLAAAGLDVLEVEPPSAGHPLLGRPDVIVSPHVAAATTRMRRESRRRAAREVALVLQGRWPMACVNPSVLPRLPLERWQPYPVDHGPNR